MSSGEGHNTLRKRPPFVFIAIGIFVLLVAAVIFSSAGPDRSANRLEGYDSVCCQSTGRGSSAEQGSERKHADGPTSPLALLF
jgi:hypothetical protein